MLRWGDRLFPDSLPFDPLTQSATAQLRQFGYNNNYIAYFPIDGSSSRGLLCVNHEYTNEELMFPALKERQDTTGFKDMTEELVDIEMAAHGVTVVEIARDREDWGIVLDSPYNHRISPLTEMAADDGPAAGEQRLQTSGDPSGKRIVGTLNNCAGGMTPWNTYLTAEENFHFYFWTDQRDADNKPVAGVGGDQAESYARYGVPASWQAWGKFHDRFNVDKEPNEPNRFGWIVEIDPFDPNFAPVKHTALGRFCHEGAETVLNSDGRVVVYCGDDTRGEYVYRFVTDGKYDPNDRAANLSLLSKGTLYAARFDSDGTGKWLPLVFGEQKLTPESGFKSQAEVLIDARRAADLLGATRMDRPKDVQPNGSNGKVYVILTNNDKRKDDQVDKANPRAENLFGHIIELEPRGGDHADDSFTWEILVRCGNPRDPRGGVDALWNPATSVNGWFACPDNALRRRRGTAVDGDRSRRQLATHRPRRRPLRSGDRERPARHVEAVLSRAGRRRAVRTVLHAGPGDAIRGRAAPCRGWRRGPLRFGRPSTYKNPATRWPDFREDRPPRPSVVVITKIGGGKIA